MPVFVSAGPSDVPGGITTRRMFIQEIRTGKKPSLVHRRDTIHTQISGKIKNGGVPPALTLEGRGNDLLWLFLVAFVVLRCSVCYTANISTGMC